MALSKAQRGPGVPIEDVIPGHGARCFTIDEALMLAAFDIPLLHFPPGTGFRVTAGMVHKDIVLEG